MYGLRFVWRGEKCGLQKRKHAHDDVVLARHIIMLTLDSTERVLKLESIWESDSSYVIWSYNYVFT